jgi:hypothetical protein
MLKRKRRPPVRFLQPTAEALETRVVLSPIPTIPAQTMRGASPTTPTQVVRGTDPDGAQWTLALYGPGAISVVGTDGDTFTSQTQNLQESILTITVAGSISTETRLVGTVKPSPSNGDTNVYFENLNVSNTGELGKIDIGQVSNFKTVQNGIFAIDMPDFYLAHTDPTPPATTSLIHTSAMSAGQIDIPEGVNTLRFGGVDVNYTPAGGTPLNQTGQNNEFQISLGLPIVQGTSIIVNSVNSNAEANPNATTPSGATFQDYATFLVTGRLNLFQANTITGNTGTFQGTDNGQTVTYSNVPSQLPISNSAVTPTTQTPGGTYVISAGGAATGAIGTVRVGGAATNFTTFVTEDPLNVEAAEGQLDAKIANFYVGGQTDNVELVAPSGSRDISFGLGMDNVTINSDAIQSLTVNRDATDSNVTVERSIGNLVIGGDVTNTNINVGEDQSLFTFSNFPPSVIGQPGSGVFFGGLPPTVNDPQLNLLTDNVEPIAQNGGTINARIAGDITNSIITASVDGDPSQQFAQLFGSESGNLVLPRGVINAKVEGTINNSGNPLTTSPNKAFYAQIVHKAHGPVIPSTVTYAPFKAPTVYHDGQIALKGLFKIDQGRTNFELAKKSKKAAKNAET